jgi:hypothetical protein
LTKKDYVNTMSKEIRGVDVLNCCAKGRRNVGRPIKIDGSQNIFPWRAEDYEENNTHVLD